MVSLISAINDGPHGGVAVERGLGEQEVDYDHNSKIIVITQSSHTGSDGALTPPTV